MQDFETILKAKRDYYGNTEAAIEFAAEEYARQFSNDFVELEDDRMKWALKTFPEATAISSLRKCEEEIEEIEVDVVEGHRNPVEYADAIMCLFDSAGRQGIVAAEILEAYRNKIEVNKSRKWKKNPDNSYSHIK